MSGSDLLSGIRSLQHRHRTWFVSAAHVKGGGVVGVAPARFKCPGHCLQWTGMGGLETENIDGSIMVLKLCT